MKPNGISMVAKINKGHLCLREESLSSDNDYMKMCSTQLPFSVKAYAKRGNQKTYIDIDNTMAK